MSDSEQGQMAAALEETLPPLAQAAAERSRLEHAAWDAKLAVQEIKTRTRALDAEIQRLRQLEKVHQRPEDGRLVRQQWQALAHGRLALGAEQTAAEAIRDQANAPMLQALHAHLALCTLAERHYTRMQVGMQEAVNHKLPQDIRFNWEERAEAAFADLAALVGEDEATRLKHSPDKPGWFRR